MVIEKRALKRDKEKAKKEKPLLKSYLTTRTFGQKAADAMTKWAGSWTFILGFITILILWIALNTTWLIFDKIWDPKPFILLNLALSCLAALQAPIILMSQNRSSEKDRQRTEYDYAVNRKAEREIQSMKKQLNRIEEHMMMKRKKK